MTYNYYLVPYESVSTPLPSNMCVATWTSGQPVYFSTTKTGTPDFVTTFAAGVVWECSTRNDLTPLGSAKSTPPPNAAFSATTLSDFQDQFKQWTLTTLERDFELPADARIA